MKTLKLLLVIVSLSLLLAGCWDSNEPERQFYVLGVGIDYKEGKYEVYLQVISFGNVAKSEQVNQDLTQAVIGYATGENLYDVFFELYQSLDETLYWGHFTFLVLSEESLNDHRINAIFDIFTRFSDTRYTSWVYVTDENIKDILLTVPALERGVTLTKLADPLNRHKQSSVVEPINIRKLVLGLNEPSHEVNIPYIKMTEDWVTEKGPDNITEITGVGIVDRKKFKGFIRGDQALGFRWLSHETQRAQISLKMGQGANDYISAVLEKLNFTIKPIVNGKDVKFDIEIIADAVMVNNIFKPLNNTEVQEAVEKQVKKEIEDTFTAGLELGADVYHLSGALYRNDVKLWKEIHTDGQIPLSEDSIRNVKVTLNKIGSGRKEFTETIPE